MFVALVGAAMWFARREDDVVASASPAVDAAADAGVVAGSAAPTDEDATAEPAATRDRAGWPATTFAAAAADHPLALDGLLRADDRVRRVDQIDAGGWTPLHHAASAGALRALRVLLDHRANADAVTPDERTPLHLAAAAGNTEATELLLGAGASCDAMDQMGLTALHRAARRDEVGIVEALLRAGAEVNRKDGFGETALDKARRDGATAAAAALEAAGGAPGAQVKMSEVLAARGVGDPASWVPSVVVLPEDSDAVRQAARAARAQMPRLLLYLSEHPDARVAVRFALDGAPNQVVWGEVVEPGQPLLVRVTPPGEAEASHQAEPVEVGYDAVLDWQVRLDDGRVAGGYVQRATLEAIRAEYGALPPAAEAELARLVDL